MAKKSIKILPSPTIKKHKKDISTTVTKKIKRKELKNVSPVSETTYSFITGFIGISTMLLLKGIGYVVWSNI